MVIKEKDHIIKFDENLYDGYLLEIEWPNGGKVYFILRGYIEIKDGYRYWDSYDCTWRHKKEESTKYYCRGKLISFPDKVPKRCKILNH